MIRYTITFIFTVVPVGIILLLIYACAPEGIRDIVAECHPSVGDLCVFETNGGDAIWQIGGLPKDEDYVLAVLSTAPIADSDIRTYTHRLEISANFPSARLSEQEMTLLREIQSLSLKSNPPIKRTDETIHIPRKTTSSGSHLTYHLGHSSPQNFYVPVTSDYRIKVSDELASFFIPSMSDPNLSGKKNSFKPWPPKESFQIFYHPETFPKSTMTLADRNNNFRQSLKELESCLDKTIPQLLEIMGNPLDLDGEKPIRFLLSRLKSENQMEALGIFSERDRFEVDGKTLLGDSNRSEIIYLNENQNAATACTTAAHELQHLVSFDYKVLRQIPDGRRHDMAEVGARHLVSEERGLNEGYSHIVELLSGPAQNVDYEIYSFLQDANGTSFALEPVFYDGQENIETRGLNTLLLYYVIRRAGGRLDLSDPTTRHLLTSLIQSPLTGLKNIAQYFQISVSDLRKDFIKGLVLSLFHAEHQTNFLPPLEESDYKRGIRFMDRNEKPNPEEIHSRSIHPLQVDSPLLTSPISDSITSQSLHLYRYIVPEGLTQDAYVRVSTRSTQPFAFYVIRVR